MATPQPIKSRFVNGGCPTRCSSCSEPFLRVDNHVEAYRHGAFYFCSEMCAGNFAEPTPLARAH